MRILHLTAPAQFGGLERVVSGLARASAERGHDVVVQMTLSPGTPIPGWATSLAEHGVAIEPTFVAGRAYLAERRSVRDLLSRHRSEIVHSHGYRSDVLHRGVAHRAQVPIVTTAHGFASKTPGYSLYERLQVWSWKRFDAVVAVSEPLERQLLEFGVPRSRLVQIRNGVVRGVDPFPRAIARGKLGLPVEGLVFGWVGRFSDEKDPALAIEAFARLADAGATLCLIGTGPLADLCSARAEELGVAARVVFCGPQPDAAPLLSAFDALVLSSRTEGTPMVVLESAAAGVPVIATRVGGVPAVVGEDGGWLVPAGDAEALATAMRSALTDARARAERGEALRARVEAQGAANDWVEEYLALYARLQRPR
jgi:glycosyltransferase involved in cell wall biosynthesis